MRFRTLRGKILVTFLGSLLIGFVLAVGISTIFVVSFSQNTADNIAEVMLREELLNLDRLAQDSSSRNGYFFLFASVSSWSE